MAFVGDSVSILAAKFVYTVLIWYFAAMFSTFDRLDIKLFAELDRDSRQSYAQLAKKLKLGSDLVGYRVERYTRDQLIGRFSAVVDPFVCGWWIFKNYLKVETGSRRAAALLRFLERHPRTYWLAELHGRFDIVCNICAASPTQCEEFQDELRRQFGAIILEHEVTIITSVSRLSRKYLSGREPEEYVLCKKGNTAIALESAEVAILNLLYDDARMSAVELAAKVGISAGAVRSRIERLEHAGVIHAYRFQLNYERFGLVLAKLLIQPGQQTAPIDPEILEFCRRHRSVVTIIRQFGHFPLEIEVEVEGLTGLNAFVEEFRKRFDAGVRSCEVLLVKQDLYHRFPSTPPPE